MADQHTHTRIDEGVKRGPRLRNGRPTIPSNPADLGSRIIPDGLDPDEVIDRYMSEQTTSQIARQYGLSRKAITGWLRETRPAKWKQAQILRSLCIKEDAENGLACAADALSLARARELLRAGQWDLERLDADYRPKQEVTQTVSPVLNIAIVVQSSDPTAVIAVVQKIEEKP